MSGLSRRGLLRATGTVGLAGLAGCVGGGADGSGSTPGADPTATAAESGGGEPAGPGGGASPTATAEASGGPPVAAERLPVMWDFEELRSEVRSGGPPKDGIPSIDDPAFVDAAGADDFLDPRDVVFGLVGDEGARAYPQIVLVWHEVCNDVLDGEPISVTYCPLTGTAQGFGRGETTFGVSGRLLNNNLVMYDRATDSRWPQVLGTAISGPLEGRSLTEFRVIWTTWGAWRDLYPETAVLSTETGFARNYGIDPYGSYVPKSGYYSREGTMFPPLAGSDRYHGKRVVVGARTPAGAIAFLKDAIRESGVLVGELGGVAVAAVHDGRLDTAFVYRNPDGHELSVDGGAVSVAGESYAPGALPLERLVAFDAMWFAWSGYYPETVVVE